MWSSEGRVIRLALVDSEREGNRGDSIFLDLCSEAVACS